jgi:hypothetical protein
MCISYIHSPLNITRKVGLLSLNLPGREEKLEGPQDSRCPG